MEVTEDPFVETWLEKIGRSARNLGHISGSTSKSYKSNMRRFMLFVNSEKDLEDEITPSDLIEEAKEDSERAIERINLFNIWSQGENASDEERTQVENYKPYGKSLKPSSAAAGAFATIRSFYTYNGVDFGKWRTPKIGEMEKPTVENDREHAVFVFNEETHEIDCNFSVIKDLLAVMSLRDQALLMSFLTTGQDSVDLLKLTLGWLRKQDGRRRLSWRGVRTKTKIRFWTFFSCEATEVIRKYVEVERKGASGREKIFIGTGGRRLAQGQVSKNFKKAAETLGHKAEEGQNPFRPKRMRHIFRTACGYAGIPDDRAATFMGHSEGISMAYIERNLREHEAEKLIRQQVELVTRWK